MLKPSARNTFKSAQHKEKAKKSLKRKMPHNKYKCIKGKWFSRNPKVLCQPILRSTTNMVHAISSCASFSLKKNFPFSFSKILHNLCIFHISTKKRRNHKTKQNSSFIWMTLEESHTRMAARLVTSRFKGEKILYNQLTIDI